MAKICGSAFIPRINWLKEHHAGAWEQIVAGVRADTRDLLTVRPLATGWYPFEQFVDLMETADRIAGAGDLELVRVLGHHAATANLSTWTRAYLEATGCKAAVVKETRCRLSGHDRCRYEAQWA